ncbi:hypothetical protein C1645_824566 [Glomus cerebriforme]|uniref:Uncharacterized protein n=1 Tax=Glomus cerebriforme TaxID=658196 RepID=A0A397SYD9_9GLOM|nr:hypothetical protein C1645_824566 [Glomus cerebriforme]
MPSYQQATKEFMDITSYNQIDRIDQIIWNELFDSAPGDKWDKKENEHFSSTPEGMNTLARLLEIIEGEMNSSAQLLKINRNELFGSPFGGVTLYLSLITISTTQDLVTSPTSLITQIQNLALHEPMLIQDIISLESINLISLVPSQSSNIHKEFSLSNLISDFIPMDTTLSNDPVIKKNKKKVKKDKHTSIVNIDTLDEHFTPISTSTDMFINFTEQPPILSTYFFSSEVSIGILDKTHSFIPSPASTPNQDDNIHPLSFEARVLETGFNDDRNDELNHVETEESDEDTDDKDVDIKR